MVLDGFFCTHGGEQLVIQRTASELGGLYAVKQQMVYTTPGEVAILAA